MRDSLVTGYEALIESLSLPDPDDRHVLAAAIHSKAEIIVTFNLTDFPVSALASYGIEAEHPDVFISKLIDTAADRSFAATKLQRGAEESSEECRRISNHPGICRSAKDCRSAKSLS